MLSAIEASIETIPPELLQEIFKYLDLDDIIKLPPFITSRGLIASHDAFHQLKRVRVSIERESLNKLIQMSLHPVIAENVHVLTVSTDWLPDVKKQQYLEYVWERYYDEIANPLLRHPKLKFSMFDRWLKEKRCSDMSMHDHYRAFRAAVKDQQKLTKSVKAFVFFKDAINHFAKLTTIRIDNFPEEHLRLLLSGGYQYYKLDPQPKSHVIKTLFGVLVTAELDSLRRIEVYGTRGLEYSRLTDFTEDPEEPSTAALMETISALDGSDHDAEKLPKINVLRGKPCKIVFSSSKLTNNEE